MMKPLDCKRMAEPFGAYYVSGTGEVWRRINATHPERVQWQKRKLETDKDGYLRVEIRGKKFLLHRLVYSLFCGPLVPGLVVCHLDNDRQNNRPENLLQAEQAVNISHKEVHGTHQRGERHGNAQIDDATAAQIKARLSALLVSAGRAPRGSLSGLADELGVSRHIVYDIRSGKAWTHA